MLRNTLTAALFALFLIPAAAQADYSSVITDLPLMPTMKEDPSKIVAFDTPDGRILETTAETTAQLKQVLGYYGQTLPSLGWKLIKGTYNVYNREKEMLTIEVFQKPGAQGVYLVQFKIAPAPKGGLQ